MAVFYSFHYQRDSHRVQQILNMGALEGHSILNAQEWESVKRRGDSAIEKWIEEQMAYKSAVVVLVGAGTADRRWVKREIAYAWDNRKPLVGVRIHGLQGLNQRTDSRGPDPFSRVTLRGGGTVADHVTLHDPGGVTSQDVYASIKRNIKTWADAAYQRS